jgi:mono/diheme cytochrome c family protein
MSFSHKLITGLGITSVLTVLAFCTVTHMQEGLLAHSWKAPREAADKKNSVEMSKSSIESGRILYSEYCAGCHGKKVDGQGSVGVYLKTKPPDLRQRAKNHADGDLFWKIQHGKGDMPSFEKKLQDKEIWSITNYLRSLAK